MPLDGNVTTKTITPKELGEALRRPMPEGFEGDYSNPRCCAIGLSARLTRGTVRAGRLSHMEEWLPEAAQMPLHDWHRIFNDPRPSSLRFDLTPVEVAERIDAYLARCA